MQSFYDLHILADYRIQQRHAEADRERLAGQARRSNAGMTGLLSSGPLRGVLRITSRIEPMRAILAEEDHAVASLA